VEDNLECAHAVTSLTIEKVTQLSISVSHQKMDVFILRTFVIHIKWAHVQGKSKTAIIILFCEQTECSCIIFDMPALFP
jgi:hypothetical protein